MKRLLLLLVVFVSISVSAQVRRYYCEIKGTEKDFSSDMKIIFDFGQNSSYSLWTNLNSQMKFVDEEGKVIEFNSMVDAMNFMSDKGWKFQQAYTTNRNSKSIEHWILYKDAESKEKACEGIVTKEEYDKLNR